MEFTNKNKAYSKYINVYIPLNNLLLYMIVCTCVPYCYFTLYLSLGYIDVYAEFWNRLQDFHTLEYIPCIILSQ